MDPVELFKCLADAQRLRLLNLLEAGPLCVCHLQSILEAPQVKISKQLAYLKNIGLAEAERRGTWMIYRLAEPIPAILLSNLDCLRANQDAAGIQLQTDSRARTRLLKKLTEPKSTCPENLSRILCCE
jgi:ArsR family transcriptional regulator